MERGTAMVIIYHNYSGTYSTILPCMGTILWNLKLGDLVGKIPFILCIVCTYRIFLLTTF